MPHNSHLINVVRRSCRQPSDVKMHNNNNNIEHPHTRIEQCQVVIFRGQKLNPNIFFSNFSGASGISRQNPGISRQKSLIPWVSRDIPNFLAPTPSRGRPPPHRKISGLKSLGLGSFFVPEFSLLMIWGFGGPGVQTS